MNRAMLRLIILIHFILIVVNIAAIPILMSLPYYLYCVVPSTYSVVMGVALATPLIVFIVRLGYHWNRCPITDIENRYRDRLGLPKINGFLNYYLAKGRDALCSRRQG